MKPKPKRRPKRKRVMFELAPELVEFLDQEARERMTTRTGALREILRESIAEEALGVGRASTLSSRSRRSHG